MTRAADPADVNLCHSTWVYIKITLSVIHPTPSALYKSVMLSALKQVDTDTIHKVLQLFHVPGEVNYAVCLKTPAERVL